MLYFSISLTYVSHRDKITFTSWITGYKQSFFTNTCHSEALIRLFPLLWILIPYRASAFQGTVLYSVGMSHLLRELCCVASLSSLLFTSFSRPLNFSRSTFSPYFVIFTLKHHGRAMGPNINPSWKVSWTDDINNMISFSYITEKCLLLWFVSYRTFHWFCYWSISDLWMLSVPYSPYY